MHKQKKEIINDHKYMEFSFSGKKGSKTNIEKFQLKKYSLMYNEAAYTIWQGQIHANYDSPPKLIDFHLLRVKSHSNALVRTYILFLALSRNNEFLCIKNSCGRYFDRKNLLANNNNNIDINL